MEESVCNLLYMAVGRTSDGVLLAKCTDYLDSSEIDKVEDGMFNFFTFIFFLQFLYVFWLLQKSSLDPISA